MWGCHIHWKTWNFAINPPTQICLNRIENKFIIKIRLKTGYYLQLLMTETIKLLGSTENKIIKDTNGENVPHLEINEVILNPGNIGNNYYQHDSNVLLTFISNKLT